MQVCVLVTLLTPIHIVQRCVTDKCQCVMVILVCFSAKNISFARMLTAAVLLLRLTEALI